MNFENALIELEKYSTEKIIKDYKLSTIHNFVDYLGLDTTRYFIVHITGTSGKGSTANFVSNILGGQGVNVGLFTSPHITSVRERISVKGKSISEEDFGDLFWFVMGKMKNFMSKTGERKLTYFEVIFAVALLYFDKKGIDVGVFEVGLGGKLDTTNILKGDVAVITNVGLDHTEILGDTVEKIVMDKVQIVKEGAVCVSGVTQESVKKIVVDWCQKIDVKLLLLGKELGCILGRQSIKGTDFDYYNKAANLKNLQIQIPGQHQVENATIALEVSLICLDKINRQAKVKFSEEALRNSLLNTKISGRFEIKQREPLVILDGAHNADKIRALVNTINEVTTGDISVLFAVKKGKDYKAMIDELVKLGPRLKKVVLTKYKLKQDVELESGPASIFEELLVKAVDHKIDIVYEPDSKMACNGLLSGQKKNEVMLVTGSFYLLASLLS
jgi:dihydrofolate synthase / folylpolyglutamate synthase